MIDEQNGPLGITANSKGDILVIEKLRNIIKFDANRLTHKLVAQKKLKALHCIAIDDEDNICCIDQVCNRELEQSATDCINLLMHTATKHVSTCLKNPILNRVC